MKDGNLHFSLSNSPANKQVFNHLSELAPDSWTFSFLKQNIITQKGMKVEMLVQKTQNHDSSRVSAHIPVSTVRMMYVRMWITFHKVREGAAEAIEIKKISPVYYSSLGLTESEYF